MRVHLNGRLVEETEARISVFDRGFLFGDGIFESMRARNGKVFRLDRHLARLERSAFLIDLALPETRTLGHAVRDLLDAEGLTDARVRLTVTRGPGRPGDYVNAPGPPTVVISAAPFAGIDRALRERGVAVVIARRRAMPADVLDPSIKSTSRLVSVLARREAQQHGAFESIWLDSGGCLTEGTASNLFLVSAGRLSTPAIADGSLPGITREAIIEQAREAGIPIIEERLPAGRLEQAEEAFLTNTSWEVLPVVSVDGRAVGDGQPGPVARDLLRRYTALVARECSGE